MFTQPFAPRPPGATTIPRPNWDLPLEQQFAAIKADLKALRRSVVTLFNNDRRYFEYLYAAHPVIYANTQPLAWIRRPFATHGIDSLEPDSFPLTWQPFRVFVTPNTYWG